VGELLGIYATYIRGGGGPLAGQVREASEMRRAA
jgi:hypothetical protein